MFSTGLQVAFDFGKYISKSIYFRHRKTEYKKNSLVRQDNIDILWQ